MKQCDHQQQGIKYTGSVRDMIQIILNPENFDNRGIREKPELLVLFLPLLPDYFVEDGGNLARHILFRNTSMKRELTNNREPNRKSI